MDEEYGGATRLAKRRPAGGGRPGAGKPEHVTRGEGCAIDPAEFRPALLSHFDRHRRPLPWRADRNPYRVMVSEFMLQQTRAETVGPHYARWLRRFPDWRALAAASLDDVVLAWKGLGYYSRARNLHRTARTVQERCGGELPEDPAALRSLPGVGEYTAGAVASIAFGKPVPAVDGNVRRVLARLLDLPRPTPAQLRREAARLLDHRRPGDHNEAMMELGATICTPRAPRCGECPVASWCAARQANTVAERPARLPARPARRVDYATVVAIAPSGRVLLVKRPERGLLAGMWEFPSVELHETAEDRVEDTAPRGGRPFAAVAAPALEHLATFGLRGRPAQLLTPVRHAFTHLRATYHGVVVRCDPGAVPTRTRGAATRSGEPAERRRVDPISAWIHPTDLDGYALPVAQQRIARLLQASMRTAWYTGSEVR